MNNETSSFRFSVMLAALAALFATVGCNSVPPSADAVHKRVADILGTTPETIAEKRAAVKAAAAKAAAADLGELPSTVAEALEVQARGGAANRVRAAKALLEMSRGGDPEAQYELARVCERGTGLKAPAPRKAVFWADRAATGGSTDAMVLLGIYWTAGFGVDADAEAAMRSFQKAQDGGSALGALLLAAAEGQGEDVLLEKASLCKAAEVAKFADVLDKFPLPEAVSDALKAL